jgi:nucleotide-binding universal stress UspA family protein
MTWNVIVVGVDLSPESLRAVEVAAHIATATNAQLVPVHAVPAIPVFADVTGLNPMPVYSPELQDVVTSSSRARVERELQSVLPATAVRPLEVQVGPAPLVIADVARRRQADLVVLGGKHHGALARGLGRSTAHYLVRTLDMPLLVVAQSAAPIRKVLAAVDFSALSIPMVEAARQLAKLLDAHFRLLHVVEPFRMTHLAPDQWDEGAYYRSSQEIFDRFAAPFKAIAKGDRVIRNGLAAETIVEEAGAWQADLIVVGSHGKGWVDRILIGSTTERLVTELPTSILVVPAKTIRQKPVKSKAPQRSHKRRTRGVKGRR